MRFVLSGKRKSISKIVKTMCRIVYLGDIRVKLLVIREETLDFGSISCNNRKVLSV